MTCTRPDIAPSVILLGAYNICPNTQHYKAAIHALKYLFSTSDYGTSFSSKASSTLQAHNHFPQHHDKEAYIDAIPPSPSECDRLTAFSDACWGGQIGNSVPDGTPLELFKLRSLSGHIICRAGGPISWKCLRQEHTALSSAEAEIIATNECIKEVLSIKNRAEDIDIADATNPTPVYNDNQACVDWARPSNLTYEKIRSARLTPRRR